LHLKCSIQGGPKKEATTFEGSHFH